MHEGTLLPQTHPCRHSKGRSYTLHHQHLEIQEIRNHKPGQNGLDFRNPRTRGHIHSLSRNTLGSSNHLVTILITSPRCRSRQRPSREHRHPGANNAIHQRQPHIDPESPPILPAPRIPLFAIFALLGLPCPHEGPACRTALFAICKKGAGAVAYFPVTDSRFRDVDAERHTGGQDADEGTGDPALAGVEGGKEPGAEAGMGVDGASAEGVFDLGFCGMVSW